MQQKVSYFINLFAQEENDVIILTPGHRNFYASESCVESSWDYISSQNHIESFKNNNAWVTCYYFNFGYLCNLYFLWFLSTIRKRRQEILYEAFKISIYKASTKEIDSFKL